MTHVLHLDASARRGGAGAVIPSSSRLMSAALVDALRAREPGLTVARRDLAATPVPPVDEAWVDAAFGISPERTPLSLAEELIAEVEAADVLVLGVPVYNFSVPAAFKAWIDQVILLGRTYEFTPTVPRGLLHGKRAAVLRASGTSPDILRSADVDHHTPWVRLALGFIGITEVEVVESYGADAETATRTREEALTVLGPLADRLLAPRVIQLDAPREAPVAAG